MNTGKLFSVTGGIHAFDQYALLDFLARSEHEIRKTDNLKYHLSN